MSTPSVDLSLTPRQRRLRALMTVVLVGVAAMLVGWFTLPVFHASHPAVVTPVVQRAIQLKLVICTVYLSTMFLMALALVLLAWLDIRETRVKVLMARQDMWKDVSERSRDRQGKPSNR